MVKQTYQVGRYISHEVDHSVFQARIYILLNKERKITDIFSFFEEITMGALSGEENFKIKKFGKFKFNIYKKNVLQLLAYSKKR